ncbi:hypothetical protein MMC29_008473, partial [Sticta canariensis]|nr:hypothetical protein [Sticta canariensis]
RTINSVAQKDMPQRGLVESVAPSFLGWAQKAYIKKLHISMTQDIRTTAGTSSWSKLFAHCGIQPADLIQFGGHVFPAVTGDLGPGFPRLADLTFDNGRVLYGFSQSEFTTLLIICGFPLSDFSISGCTTSTKFLGHMQLADSEPFSQIARFDPHEGCRIIAEDKEHYINDVPVHTCIDYALGMIRTPKRGDHSLVIPASILSSDTDHSEFAAWTAKPRTTQLNQIRYALEQLVSVSGAEVLNYSVETNKDIEYEVSTMKRILPNFGFEREKCRQLLLIAHALAALQPWGLLPVLPNHFVQAFKPLIFPFIGSRPDTVNILQEYMRNLKLKPLDGWDNIEQQAMGLDHVGDIRTEFFSRSCAPCRWYFKAMTLVFDTQKFRIDDVRITLAALATRRYLEGTSIPDEFVPNLKAYLNQERPMEDVPLWAVRVFATYLWGWLNDFIPMEFDLGGFKRRVFLS